MELFRQTNIDFLRWKWWAIGASWALILVGLLAIFVQKGLRFGIDFAGGTQIALRFVSRPDIDHLRKVLDAGNFGDFGIQRYEEAEKNEVLIRVQQQAKEGRDITSEVLNLLRQGLAGAIDPAKIDLNVQGRDSLAARLAAFASLVKTRATASCKTPRAACRRRCFFLALGFLGAGRARGTGAWAARRWALRLFSIESSRPKSSSRSGVASLRVQPSKAAPLSLNWANGSPSSAAPD